MLLRAKTRIQTRATISIEMTTLGKRIFRLVTMESIIGSYSTLRKLHLILRSVYYKYSFFRWLNWKLFSSHSNGGGRSYTGPEDICTLLRFPHLPGSHSLQLQGRRHFLHPNAISWHHLSFELSLELYTIFVYYIVYYTVISFRVSNIISLTHSCAYTWFYIYFWNLYFSYSSNSIIITIISNMLRYIFWGTKWFLRFTSFVTYYAIIILILPAILTTSNNSIAIINSY